MQRRMDLQTDTNASENTTNQSSSLKMDNRMNTSTTNTSYIKTYNRNPSNNHVFLISTDAIWLFQAEGHLNNCSYCKGNTIRLHFEV